MPPCVRCREVVIAVVSTRSRYYKEILHRNINDLIEGFRSSCYFCHRVTKEIFGFRTIDSLEAQKPVCETICESGWDEFYFYISDSTIERHSDLRRRIYWEMTLFQQEDGDWPQVGPSTGSQQSWGYVASRLDNCESTHDKCGGTSSWVPTRLVEVMKSPQGFMSFRVISTNNGWSEKYVTLSHRWYKTDATLQSVTPMLTSETRAEYEREIPPNTMPKKFIETAMVAGRLGINHIWIDSLVCCFRLSCLSLVKRMLIKKPVHISRLQEGLG